MESKDDDILSGVRKQKEKTWQNIFPRSGGDRDCPGRTSRNQPESGVIRKPRKVARILLTHLDMYPNQEFEFLLERECRWALRRRRYLSILLIGVKPLSVDSDVLLDFCNHISHHVRENDPVRILEDYRVGVILRSASEDHMLQVQGRIREGIRAYFEQLGEPVLVNDIQLGGACFPTHATTSRHLLQVAQQSLR